MREQIGREFDEIIKNLDEEDPFHMSTLKSLERKKEGDLVLKNIIKQKKRKLETIETKISMVSCVKSIAVKQ